MAQIELIGGPRCGTIYAIDLPIPNAIHASNLKPFPHELAEVLAKHDRYELAMLSGGQNFGVDGRVRFLYKMGVES